MLVQLLIKFISSSLNIVFQSRLTGFSNSHRNYNEKCQSGIGFKEGSQSSLSGNFARGKECFKDL